MLLTVAVPLRDMISRGLRAALVKTSGLASGLSFLDRLFETIELDCVCNGQWLSPSPSGRLSKLAELLCRPSAVRLGYSKVAPPPKRNMSQSDSLSSSQGPVCQLTMMKLSGPPNIRCIFVEWLR